MLTYEELPPKRRRRLLFQALARPVLSSVVMLVVYYLLPLDRPSSVILVAFGVGLLALGAMLLRQVRVVMASPYPLLRAIEAVATMLPFFILLFAAVFAAMSSHDPSAFTEALGRTDALYFALTVFATVGFGDIAAVTEAARVAVIVQMTGNLIFVGLVARVLVGAAQSAAYRSADRGRPPLP
ncbi:potassium channel family protein [Georgenia sp. SYP-B2076]|uniref:potassium channel family protein n=1 Tax=Georgenia sp. SYP-B2076 TaxID=2495881 RepID=UPI000F8C6F9F|nr:potassium channel family protein [Georgenia sp. SYP-B2076]